MTTDVLLARLAFATVETGIVALLAALALRILKPAPRIVALCWAVVLLKPLVSLAVGSPIAVLRLDRSPAVATPAAIAIPSGPAEVIGSPRVVDAVTSRRLATRAPVAPPAGGAASRDVTSPAASRATSGGDEHAPDRAPVSSASALPSLATLLAGAWAAGVACMLARSVRERLRIRRLIAGSRRAQLSLRRLARQIAAPLGLRSLPDLRVTNALDSPALVSLSHPTVLLPEWMAAEPERRMVRWSLRHELTHFKQRDVWLLLLRELAQAAFFFHPAIHWAGRRLEVAMELACDRAIVASPRRARAYARQLVAIRERVREDRALAIGGAFVAKTRLVERVRELVGETTAFGAERRGARTLLPAALLLLIPVGARLQSSPPAPAPAANPSSSGAGKPVAAGGGEALKGRVVDEAGQPVAKATVRLVKWNSDLHWIDPSVPSTLELGSVVVDDAGRFELPCPPDLRERPGMQLELVAAAPGHAPAARSAQYLRELRDRTLVLSTEDAPVEARLVDLEGRPIAGATVRVKFASALEGITFDELMRILAQHPGPRAGASFFAGSSVPVGAASVEARSDAQGRFRLSGYGRDRRLYVDVLADGYELAVFEVFTHPGADFSALRPPERSAMMMQNEFMVQFDERTPRYGPKFTHALAPEQRVTGIVVDATTGEPIPDCRVYDQALEYHIEDRTDAEGRFDLKHLPRRDQDIQVRVRPPHDEAWLSKLVAVAHNPSLAPVDLRVALARGIRIHGRVLDPANRGPVRVRVEYYPYADNPNAASTKAGTWSEETGTDADGCYSLAALPGPGFVAVHKGGPGVYEFCSARAEDFHRDPGQLGYVVAGGVQVPREFMHEARYVEPAADAKELELDITLRRGNRLVLHVRDRDGKPVQRCRTIARAVAWPFEEETDGSDVTVTGLEHGVPRQVLLFDDSTSGALTLDLTGDESGERDVKLEDCAWLAAHLVDEEGRPLSHCATSYTEYFANGAFSEGVGGPNVHADADGRLRVPLAPRFKYSFGVPKPGGKYPDTLFETVEFTLKPGEVKDLGELRFSDQAKGMYE